MPVHLSDLNRREFLGTLGAGVAAFSAETLFAGETSTVEVEDDLVYLLNDTHIGEKHPANSPIPSHLRQVVEELVARKRKPASVFINGDLALKDGQPGDYRHFANLIQPLRTAKIDLHLTLGNHDHRDVFYEVLQKEQPKNPPVKSRHISVVKTRFANFFLMDTLKKTMVVQGELGKQQLKWLTEALDAFADKPAILVMHHNPRLGGDPVHFPGGLIDSQKLWDILVTRMHVKAFVHGHIHDRNFFEHQGIHIINNPATSYVANKMKSTTGWTTAKLSREGMVLTTHTNLANHPWNGQVRSLTWRS